jgi:hypothetical protein
MARFRSFLCYNFIENAFCNCLVTCTYVIVLMMLLSWMCWVEMWLWLVSSVDCRRLLNENTIFVNLCIRVWFDTWISTNIWLTNNDVIQFECQLHTYTYLYMCLTLNLFTLSWLQQVQWAGRSYYIRQRGAKRCTMHDSWARMPDFCSSIR